MHLLVEEHPVIEVPWDKLWNIIPHIYSDIAFLSFFCHSPLGLINSVCQPICIQKYKILSYGRFKILVQAYPG